MTLRAVSLAILATTLRLLSQEEAPPVSRIVESGPDYSVWENIEQIRTEEGFVSVTNRPIQIESGLNIQDAKGQWSLASPKLEVSKDGLLASATHLRFQASFASSAAAVSLFDVMLPDGGRLMGRVLGLAYVDQDGQSILFAEPADTGGVIGGPEQNEIVFASAFQNIDADLVYRVTRGGVSQNLVIKGKLPPPADFQLSDKSTLVLFTELTAHPEIKNPLRTLSEATDQSVAIPDEDIDLGSMQFLPGRGFMLDGNSGSVAVAKSVQVIEELTVSGGVTNLAKVYTPGLGLISQRQRPSATVSFYGTDGHGSVRFLASTAGAITDTYTFDAFGTLIASTGTTANNFLFCGEQWDPDLARYFNRARYWEPGIGRFSSRDTIQGSQSDPVSLHQYLYCHDDGVNNADPSGQMTLADVQVAVSTWGLLATTVAYRAAPYINRATVLLFEANTGNTVYLGGGGAAVALRAGTKLGGVGWATWQSIGNLLKGLGARIGTHKELAKVLERTGEQANHLNQAAAFPRIPYDEGVAAAIRGGTNLKGTAHHLFHESLETFWNQFRRNGARFRDVPKNAEYDTAMRRALEAAGETSENIEPFAKLAEESRRAFGYFDGPGGVAPEVPNPIPGY